MKVSQQDETKSHRICQKCYRQLLRVRESVNVLEQWRRNEGELETTQQQTPKPSNKRDREPTPSKTPRDPKKRLLRTPQKASTPQPAKRSLSQVPARRSVTKVSVTYPSRPERPDNITCDDAVAGIVENLARGQWKTAARMIFTCENLAAEIKSQTLHQIETECKQLTAKSNDFILWKKTSHDLENFSFTQLYDDLGRLSPLLQSILQTVSQSKNHTCASASVALRGREPRLSAFSYYIDAVLQYGGAKKAVYTRLSKLGISTTQGNGRLKQQEMAKECGKGIRSLKRQMEEYKERQAQAEKEMAVDTGDTRGREEETHMQTGAAMPSPSTETPVPGDTRGREEETHMQTCAAMPSPSTETPVPMSHLNLSESDLHDLEVDFIERVTLNDADDAPPTEPTCNDPPPPPTYSIIFDNLDFYVHTHHQSQSNKNKSIHWSHHIGVPDRVSSHHLPNDAPIQPLPLFDIANSLPSPNTQACLRSEFIIIGSRILTRHVPAFRRFSPVIINHIPHQYSDVMSQPSTEFPLGLLFKNENVRGDLVDMLQYMQREYVPRTQNGVDSIFVGGDRLTEGNSRNAQWSFAEGECPEERLEGLLFQFLDWHAIVNLYQVHEKIFCRKKSARDHGTLYANMNKLGCSNAKKGPHAAYNPYKEVVHKDTCAMFIEATSNYFGTDILKDGDFIPQEIQNGTKEEQRTWLHEKVGHVVDTYVMNQDAQNLTNLYIGVNEESRPQRREKPCREPGCPRVFVYPKARITHERKEHGLDFGEPDHKEELTAKPPPCDYKKQHTEARLSFGLFLEDMQDAVKEGDGERLMRLYTVALLYYKAYGHTQYSYSVLLLTVQINSILSPQKAHSLTWNRFYNGKGGKGRNIPLDLHLEHLNNFLKSFLKGLGPNLTERSADRISKSLGTLKTLLKRTDEELGVASPSGYHHSANPTQDVHTLVEVIREADLFSHYPGRAFTAFPNFDRNLFAPLKYDKMWEWIKNSLKLWNNKYP
ncbi:PREDICTED: uncharacterized protein LOC109470395 [Branchiostoma belcheri]|uniref:Uncharacterized protein LOC109470395 n=1 Tax=Branchiostoma belcheri TaxID=7741 RepID=A0A6P4Z1F4_BRABE|nr:PREDICTED: uncharacterized protein LOC109470395 [Branchiostoma belcheri]